MEAFQIAGIGIIGAILALTIKKWQPELSMTVAIAVGIILVFSVLNSLGDILIQFDDIISDCGISPQYLKLVVKLTGIAYITKFASDICRDAGETAIAGKVDFAGKIIVFSLTIPVISAFLNLIIEIITTI